MGREYVRGSKSSVRLVGSEDSTQKSTQPQGRERARPQPRTTQRMQPRPVRRREYEDENYDDYDYEDDYGYRLGTNSVKVRRSFSRMELTPFKRVILIMLIIVIAAIGGWFIG
ncbi:hypothetical protein, partial [Paraclostridium bifermentans]